MSARRRSNRRKPSPDARVQKQNSSVVSDVGDKNTPPPLLKVPRLTSIAAVRREICRQYVANLRGEVGNKTLHVRVFALKVVRDSFIADDLEQRIRALEKSNA